MTTIRLVEVPPSPETHERRMPRRSYLAQGGGGGMDELISAMSGRRPKKIEVTRTVREEPEDEPQETPTNGAPPKYGRR